MTAKPRLLVVSPTFPYPLVAGGKIRIFNLLRELSAAFRITLLALAEAGEGTPEDIEALSFVEEVVLVPIRQDKLAQVGRLLRYFPSWVRGTPVEVLVKRSAAMQREGQRLVAAYDFQAVQVEYVQGMQYLPDRQGDGPPVVLVAHDVAFVSQQRKATLQKGIFRWFWQAEARRMRRYELRQWQRSTAIMAMSEVDRQAILAALPQARVEVVANGVTVPKAETVAPSPTPTLVFTGWMRHFPNREALGWFLTEIWPLIRQRHGEVCLLVIGRAVPNSIRASVAQDHRVQFLGYVEEVAPLIARAWLSIVPIRVGSGSRLKILESLALGTPVVSTTIGCEGLAVTDGVDITIADQPEQFAAQILRLLADPEARGHLSRKGVALVGQQYSWQEIGRTAIRFLQGLQP